jgi:hypothetical protein
MATTIISTFAQDRLIKEEGIQIREGGPAYFITRVFKKLREPFELISNKPGVVEIDMRDKKEAGRVKKVSKIRFLPKERMDLVIISTLLKEYEPKAFGNVSCLDVQGYVRDNTGFGKKKLFDSPELEKFTIIKGDANEIACIPTQRLAKVPIVLITIGSGGFIIIENDKRRQYSIEKVDSPDTIGAGDTFFAAFCIKYSKTRDTVQCAEFAKRIVTDFLKEKEVRK